MHHTDLTDGWTLTAVAGPVPDALAGRAVPAHVPGTSHTALLAAGLVPDPYLDRNEASLAWMREAGWAYECLLDEPAADDDERVDLAFDGIDTVASISLDGQAVGRTANQHRAYRFDVRALVGDVPQLLRVELTAAVAYAREQAVRLGPRPAAYAEPFNMVRKMACSFGWDWGPNLQTAGLWRPVRVERWRVARLARVRPLVTIDAAGTAHVAVHVDLERSGLPGGEGPVTLTASVAGASAHVTTSDDAAVLELEVERAPLWWPVGHGAQPLHELAVTLDEPDAGPAARRDDAPLDTWSRRIGFRTVEVDTTPDEHGTPFTLLVNGRPVFVKGANWIPDDHLLTRITRERLAHRLDQALGAHVNLLRVWGGGVYESRDFYELADERGLLVWQDFLLACAAYPEEQPIWDELEAEARQNVARLSPHPSLVLWNGGNENLWGHEDWGWRDELDGRTWGLRYATELLRDVVAQVDPTRPYTANSPFSPDGRHHPNDADHGTHHQWEVWNRVDYLAYRDEVPRFCSEFGFQAPPTWATLARSVRPVDRGALTRDDPAFLAHQKAEDGNGKLDRGLAPHLGVPTDFADWHWATQLTQARAVRLAVEHYRSWWPRTAGAIVWQLNDCWPVTSWSMIDGDGRRKPAWYALRAAYAPRLLTIRRHGLRLRLAVVNDTPAIWHGTAHVERQRLDGAALAAEDLDLAVGAWSVGVFALPDALSRPGDATREVLVAALGDQRTWHAWAEDVDLELDPDPLAAHVTKEPDGYRVEVSARSLARDVTILPDRLDPGASVDDALVTLGAGERATFHVRTRAQLDPTLLARPPVLRCANDVVIRRPAPSTPPAR